MIGKSLFHLMRVWLLNEKPASQTTEQEQEAIALYSKNTKRAVEIGVFEGLNTAIITRSMANNGILYGVDPFFKGKLGISYHKIIAKININRNGNPGKVRWVEMLSFDAVKHVPDNLDFVFMDGDHSYEGIKKDWHDWSAKIKKGGFILLHDTSIPAHDHTVGQLGSYKFYKEYISKSPDFNHVGTVDSLNILQKK